MPSFSGVLCGSMGEQRINLPSIHRYSVWNAVRRRQKDAYKTKRRYRLTRRREGRWPSCHGSQFCTKICPLPLGELQVELIPLSSQSSYEAAEQKLWSYVNSWLGCTLLQQQGKCHSCKRGASDLKYREREHLGSSPGQTGLLCALC